MKTLYNFLNKDVISQAYAEVDQFKSDYRWKCSQSFWNEELLDGSVIGNVSQANVSPQLANTISDVIVRHIPKCSELWIQHYLWHPLSGINMHEDGRYSFSATIYLTQHWDNNWGGLFVYEKNEELLVLAPKFNSINITPKDTKHMVTTLSPLAPYPRYTIQIWGC